MPSMKEKIKNLFRFLGRAWSGSIRGKFGVLLALFASFMFIGLFWGNVSVQRVTMNVWHLNKASEQLNAETATLNEIQQHIKLLQNYSPDYIDELGLQYLNIGNPQVKILKY